jgi:hypothetical protein
MLEDVARGLFSSDGAWCDISRLLESPPQRGAVVLGFAFAG